MVKAGAYAPNTSIDIYDLYSVLAISNQEEKAPYVIAARVRQSINTYDQFRRKGISQQIDILGTLYTMGAAGSVDTKTRELLNTQADYVPKPNDAGELILKVAQSFFSDKSHLKSISLEQGQISPGCHSFKGKRYNITEEIEFFVKLYSMGLQKTPNLTIGDRDAIRE